MGKNNWLLNVVNKKYGIWPRIIFFIKSSLLNCIGFKKNLVLIYFNNLLEFLDGFL